MAANSQLGLQLSVEASRGLSENCWGCNLYGVVARIVVTGLGNQQHDGRTVSECYYYYCEVSVDIEKVNRPK